ncbi:MAG: hypothetical protein KJO86_04050, partial [Muriicola sp.]|nr:hypothetical protein [Muriicola sp.]
STKFIEITNRAEAIDAATWVYNRITNTPASTYTTAATLQVWASDYESPKDQIFGVVGIAIIGPTLGLISKKKKKRSKLQLVIDKKWHKKLSAKEFANLVLETSQRLIAHELRLAGGNVYNLHPDTAAWCLEEPATSIYLAEGEELNVIKSAAKNEHISFQAHTDKETLRMLAITPAINDSFVKEFEVTNLE